MIGFAYAKKMLAKQRVDHLQGDEFFTFMVDGKPQTLPFTDELARNHPYCKTKL